MATISLAPTCSLHLHKNTTKTTTSPPSRSATLLAAKNLLNVTSLRLQTTLGASVNQRRKLNLRCQAGSVDKNNDTSVEPKAEVKASSASEKQGPPFLTIIAGVVVAALVVWGLWSIISAILGIFFH